jgi:predicted DNA-binding transcriptional regulator
MRSIDEQQEPSEPGNYRELRVLSEVEETPDITQRELSRRVGIALGLTNVLLRNLVQKGYVRAIQAGWKRWIYAVTPEGFSRKLHLTISYIHRVLNDYQSVREMLREQLHPLDLNAESRVAIYGRGDFAELVYLGLKEFGIEEIEVYDRSIKNGKRFLGMPVRELATLLPGQYDRVVIASLGKSEALISELRQLGLESHQVVTFFSNGKIGEGEWPT